MMLAGRWPISEFSWPPRDPDRSVQAIARRSDDKNAAIFVRSVSNLNRR